jgi:putative Ca2+/H+ antiporter (TMEM165/GDT1 family)
MRDLPNNPTEHAVYDAAYSSGRNTGLICGVVITVVIGWLVEPHIAPRWLETATGALVLASLAIIPMTGDLVAKHWARSRLRVHRRSTPTA